MLRRTEGAWRHVASVFYCDVMCRQQMCLCFVCLFEEMGDRRVVSVQRVCGGRLRKMESLKKSLADLLPLRKLSGERYGSPPDGVSGIARRKPFFFFRETKSKKFASQTLRITVIFLSLSLSLSLSSHIQPHPGGAAGGGHPGCADQAVPGHEQ